MNNWPSRVTDNVISLLSEARRRAILFASHTTQIFQIPDVTFFGVRKRRLGYKLPFEDEKETVTLITKVYQRLQADNGGAQHMGSFSGDWLWVWVWHWHRPILTFIERAKVEAKWRFRRVAVDWVPPGSTVESEAEAEAEGQIWLNQQVRSKNKVIWPKEISLSLVSCRDIAMCQKVKKWNCGSIHRITWKDPWGSKFFIRY
jgi:hypothetical protein